LNTIKGTIIAIQEERFRLVSRDGQGYLLTLANHAAAGLRELDGWRRNETLVEVAYTGEPNLDTGVAWEVRPV
jgi:hypothetical protein